MLILVDRHRHEYNRDEEGDDNGAEGAHGLFEGNEIFSPRNGGVHHGNDNEAQPADVAEVPIVEAEDETKASLDKFLSFCVFSIPCTECLSDRLHPISLLIVNVADPSHDPATPADGGAGGGNLSRAAQKRSAEALRDADKNEAGLNIQSVLSRQKIENLKTAQTSETITREITRATTCMYIVLYVHSDMDCVFVRALCIYTFYNNHHCRRRVTERRIN